MGPGASRQPWPAPRLAVRFTALAVTAVIVACGAPDASRLVELSGPIMGTTYSVRLAGAPETLDFDALRAQVLDALHDVDEAMSTYRSDSELSLFNASRDTGWFPVSPATAQVVHKALAVSRATDGAFDVTAGPLVNLWGFGPEPAARAVPDAAAIDAALARTGWTALDVRLEPPALRKTRADIYVDLSAIAKGFAVDRVADLLQRLEVRGYLVDIGGDLRVEGSNGDGEAWRIAVEQPRTDRRAVQSVLRLRSGAVATSGDYRNHFDIDGRRYSHEIDPKTGWPVSHALAAATVVADKAIDADAFATAFMIMGPDLAMDFAERERMAALFLVRSGDGFEERQSAQYRALASLND